MKLSDSQCMLDIIVIIKLNVISENIQVPVLFSTTTLPKPFVKNFLEIEGTNKNSSYYSIHY